MSCSIRDVEFYLYDDELWVMRDGVSRRVSEKDTTIVRELADDIMEFYPDAYNALSDKYAKSSPNVPYFLYLIVNRFVRCNFGELDTREKDIDSGGNMRFEKVRCPMRGECRYEGVVCCPRFNSKISEAEDRVMRLMYSGMTNEEIGDRLFISPHTVKNHIKHVYERLGIHEKSEFMMYAKNNGLYE